MTSFPEEVGAARKGDREAFGRLLAPGLPRFVRLARSIVGDLAADDVVQDACVTAWRRLHQLQDVTKFNNWMIRIVYRIALRTARWSRLRAPLFAQTTVAPTAAVPGDQGRDLAVWQLLSALPARQRAVLHLTVVEGMTDSEIGQALGIRPGSVRAHRRRARERAATLWSSHGIGAKQ